MSNRTVQQTPQQTPQHTPRQQSTRVENREQTFILDWLDESAIAELIARAEGNNKSIIATHITTILKNKSATGNNVYTEVHRNSNDIVSIYIKLKNNMTEISHISLHISGADTTPVNGIFHLRSDRIAPSIKILADLSGSNMSNFYTKRMRLRYNSTHHQYKQLLYADNQHVDRKYTDNILILDYLNRYFDPTDPLYIKCDISKRKYRQTATLTHVLSARAQTPRSIPQSNTRKKYRGNSQERGQKHQYPSCSKEIII